MRPSLECCGYGSERDVATGDVLFADGDQTYNLIVLLAGTADIIEGYGQPGASVVASYGPHGLVTM
jgi:hypothetical protein